MLLCFVRNDDSPRLSMAAVLIGSLANILLDYLFIFPMKMGIFGAVFTTWLSPVISMAAMSLPWMNGKNTFHFVKARPLSSGIVIITFNAHAQGLQHNPCT